MKGTPLQDRNSGRGAGRGEFDAQAFYGALDKIRIARGLSWKDVAEQAGIAASTLSRMSNGKRPDVDGLACLLVWSGLNATAFIPRSIRNEDVDTLSEIGAYLRADRKLKPESAKALEAIIRVAYEEFREK